MTDRPNTPLLDTVQRPADMNQMSDAQLAQLAQEVRSETISAVSVTGGHLGAGLGVVELTVALHAIFDTPKDKIIWDVGHQCYPHKILTERRDRIRTLRQKGGLSGFTKRSESPYDPFGAAHSSTSISAALGFAVARDLGGNVPEGLGDAIAVIGDGSMSAGMAYEAMNNAGHLGKRLIVILNDNEMSIAPPVGAMSAYLSRLYTEEPFQELKAAAKGAASLLPEPFREGARRAITAAMPDGTGLNLFAERYPSRCFDVGIAEQHGVTFAGALAAGGMKPFCTMYSTFLQRGYDQVVHDVALQRLPVRFAIDRAGLVGADGATHAGAFDIAFLANLPDFVVMAAADEAELAHMVATASAYDDGPIAFRFPRGEGNGVELPERGIPLEIGKGRMIKEGSKVALLSFGTRLAEVEKAAEKLEAKGITPTIADARFTKPLDRDLIVSLAENHDAMITIEEVAIGGFGSHVSQLLADEGIFDRGFKYRSMVLPDTFIDHANPSDMYAAAGLNADDIETKVLDILGIAQISAATA